jgi:hypothetical protein
MEVIGLTPKLEKLHLRRHHGHTRADQLREVRKGTDVIDVSVRDQQKTDLGL